jgi:hypothetical protein
MSLNLTTEAAIFERAVLSSQPGFTVDAARSLLAMQFGAEDRERMQRLADRAKQGTLCAEEESQIENYERVGHYLAILQSAARTALKTTEHSHS